MYHHQPVHAPPPPYHEHPASREGAAGDHGGHGNEQDGACGGALEENNDMSPPGRPSPGASGENEDQGEAQVVPPSGQEVPPHVVHAPVHGYPPHYHPQYPPQHHYYPPPPYGEQPPPPGSYYHPPPDAWNTPYVSYSPPSEGEHHPHGAPPPHYYPYGPTPYHPYGMPPYQEMPPVGHDPRGPSPYPSHPAPPARPPPSRETKPPAAAPARGASKSVRRKKKMYSDFVGVTYNKTHAKYQACITHYRKQHYLGRYKLAVDAALAYDESARLLKGPNWKVNFATREAYEDAKAKELDGIGKRGGLQIDVAGSLAAVAMKVEEIASLSNGNAARRATSAAEYNGHVESGVPRKGPHLTLLNGSHERLGYVTDKPLAHVPPSLAKTVGAPPDMTKVTPSPSLHVPLHEQLAPAPAPSATKLKSVDSPLPETPNPTRHAMGVEKGTPSSVIRPTALTYQKGSGPLEQGGERDTSPMANDGNEGTTRQSQNRSPAASSHGKSPSRDKAAGTPKRAPPVIQNGTLAAASALMDLFGNDTPEKEKEPTT